MRTWLFVDSNYFCYRSFFSTGGLSFGEDPTGVLFGFLRDVQNLQQTLAPTHVAFFFDGKGSKRKELDHRYKTNRKVRGDIDEQVVAGFRKQVQQLREEILRDIGYRNIFWQDGYESDDLIAMGCSQLRPQDEAIIASADHDMYQLLSARVSLWIPSKQHRYTEQDFRREMQLTPSQWIDVKSIAGCSSDCVIGIQGIGEKTAAKFLSGKLPTNGMAYQKIVLNNATWKHNVPLVALPFPGTMKLQFKKDKVTRNKWNKVARSIGARSLLTKEM